MFGRLLRLIIVLPLLGAVWAAANSLGVTALVSQATGYKIPDGFTIPGVDRVVQLREDTEQAARRQAVKALRKEIRSRYGADAAALVPSDLSVSEATRILKQVTSGADLPTITDALDKHTKPGPGNQQKKPKNAPLLNAKAYKKALRDLNTLAVKGRAPKTGYDRKQFGSEWSDKAGTFKWTGNGCDTRNDVLARDLTKIKRNGCKVSTGVLPYERYTGKKNVKFVAGGDYANALDIEHIVALGNAWVTGAQQWTEAKRAAFANDPVNLFAADPSSNRQKGDADAATWLPKNRAYRCTYVSQQVRVKKKYSLWVTGAEKDAMKRILNGCA